MTIEINSIGKCYYDVPRDTLEFSLNTNEDIDVKENYTVVNFYWVYVNGGTNDN